MATRERSDDPRAAIERGLRLLSHRARTERDLRDRLGERFSSGAVASAMRRLHELGYVGDRAWAAAYVRRWRSSRRSARLLRRERSGRGIAADVAAAATALHDGDPAALAAARDALRRLSSASASSTGRDGMAHSRRLYGALARRGLDSRAIQPALWRMRAEDLLLGS